MYSIEHILHYNGRICLMEMSKQAWKNKLNAIVVIQNDRKWEILRHNKNVCGLEKKKGCICSKHLAFLYNNLRVFKIEIYNIVKLTYTDM